jgi:hypothetical protein
LALTSTLFFEGIQRRRPSVFGSLLWLMRNFENSSGRRSCHPVVWSLYWVTASWAAGSQQVALRQPSLRRRPRKVGRPTQPLAERAEPLGPLSLGLQNKDRRCPSLLWGPSVSRFVLLGSRVSASGPSPAISAPQAQQVGRPTQPLAERAEPLGPLSLGLQNKDRRCSSLLWDPPVSRFELLGSRVSASGPSPAISAPQIC